VLDALDALQLKNLVGGAVAVWAWGDVRITRDLDLVVELPVEAIHEAILRRHDLQIAQE
jgi:hypothetical protein